MEFEILVPGFLAAGLAVAIGLVWYGPLFRTGRQLLPGDSKPTGKFWVVFVVMLLAAAMLGHAFFRIGFDTLDAKPWLYFMQSGGIAIAFVIPAVWLTLVRHGVEMRVRIVECGFWLIAYLAMGLVFWALC